MSAHHATTRVRPALLALAVATVSVGWAGAARGGVGSISYTGTYEGSSNSASYDDDDEPAPNSYYLRQASVSGISKFDPSLGDLIRVRVEGNFSYSYSASFDAQGLEQTAPGSYYQASMKLESLGAQVLFEREEAPGPLYVLASDPIFDILFEGSGNVGDGAEVSDGRSEFLSVDYVRDVSFSFVPGASFTSKGPNDRAMTTLTAGVFLPAWADFHTINFFDAWGEASVELDAGSVTVTYDYGIGGDADEDGSVNFGDLVTLAQNYNTPSGATWSQGDFTADGAVTFPDLVRLAQNYNSAASLVDLTEFTAEFAADWSRAVSTIPEPTALGALVSVAGLRMRRRRRKGA